MEKIFLNKVALVTGGSYGIGRATAVAFAQRGARVVIADWIEDNEGETLRQITEAGSEAVFVKCDVSKSSDVKAAIDKTVSTFSSLNFAFNNAGIEGIMAPVHQCTEDNWNNTISINLTGVWLCMKYELEQMLRQGKGSIVNCSSVAGLCGFATLPAYVASKHGVIGLTKTAALENAKSGIRVNAVCPGVIHTKMIDRITHGDKDAEKQYASIEPVGRMGDPIEVAEAVVWLCSDAASFITGDALAVDGGFVAA
jgi:NAD(P)-dependent dehydrogenase (short-subunit alcohol dehydrogenase family)